MDRDKPGGTPYHMLFPDTFAFPLIREEGLPREFQGVRNQNALTGFLYTLDFDYSFPLWM